jgi:hypothetical protein
MYSFSVGPPYSFRRLEISDILNVGKSAVVTTAEGLRIACIGGTYKAAVYSGSEIPHVRIHSEVNQV